MQKVLQHIEAVFNPQATWEEGKIIIHILTKKALISTTTTNLTSTRPAHTLLICLPEKLVK